MSHASLHIAVIGGGIAGLSTAHALLRRGVKKVILFEAEPELAQHSSGRSAGIWLPTEDIDQAPLWTKRSVELLSSLFGGASWISRTGAYKVAAQKDQLLSHFLAAQASGCQPEWRDETQLESALGWLASEQRKVGFYLPEAGVLDTEAILRRLCQDAVARGLSLRLGTKVRALSRSTQKGWALQGESDSLGIFDWVVDATGAWGSRLFEPLGCLQQLQVYRRHVLRWDSPQKELGSDAIVWAESPEYYVRPGPDGALWASPCDAEPVQPGCVEVQSNAQTQLEAKIERELRPASGVWSGTRTHRPSGEILRGPVPGCPGLAWILGLAGRGMTVGLGVGDATAQDILDASSH